MSSEPIPTIALLTAEDVARALRVTVRTVFNLRRRGLRSLKIGDSVRFTAEDLADYIEKSRERGGHQ